MENVIDLHENTHQKIWNRLKHNWKLIIILNHKGHHYFHIIINYYIIIDK